MVVGQRPPGRPDVVERFERAISLYERALYTHREAIDVFERVLDRWSARPAVAQPTHLEKTVSAPRLPDKPPQVLTKRQREIATLIAHGYSNAQIAETLVVTKGTAANHIAAILDRLGFTNRAQIAAWAVRVGLIEASAEAAD